ncbi:MAG: transcription-repair coupling factor [Marinilabiliales bacterium]|nr:transcription-repair coupling factor [Marinilabiliales bacterium]
MAGSQDKPISLSGMSGSMTPLLFSVLKEMVPYQALFILNDREEAAFFYDDLRSLSRESELLFFPSSFKRNIWQNHLDNENVILRTDVLHKLAAAEQDYLVVTYPEAIIEPVVSQSGLLKNTLHVQKGDRLSIAFVNELLYSYGFERVEFVFEPGQFSIRGSIVDIFSFSHEDPYRIDFFGDIVDSIRSFDIEDQISKVPFEYISIIPNIQEGIREEKRVPFFEFLHKKSFLVSPDFHQLSNQLQNLQDAFLEASEAGNIEQQNEPLSAAQFKKYQKQFPLIQLKKDKKNESLPFEFQSAPQPVFHKNFDLLGSNLKENRGKGYHNIILSSSAKQIERLHAIFDDKGDPQKLDTLPFALREGFVDHDLKICCYNDHQIFERYHRSKLKSAQPSRQAITLKELSKLQVGDYVVHTDHGIGKFAGLVRTEVNGNFQEAVRLIYRDNDSLLVSIHALHRISKYKGKEGQEPAIHKLGTAAWQNLKTRTKNKVKDIARELIALYAARKMEQGFSFSPDSYLQQELEASFIYEDTPDQLKATLSVKEDMERQMPMDRLICGDVGFGKTEVAIRAAFKAVADNKQVAVLVPTTILALQHFRTFRERLRNFPCNVEYISRLRHASDVKRVLQELTMGKVDILIGTHKMIGKEVKFKDLGLLIVDEEQRFGVSVKEKLKQLKVNVDTLTLTATPIPRTLQFSLMGARDLSIISTPPPNRYPIATEVHSFDEEIIREAINYEIARGGQVFFIHNRITNIFQIEKQIRTICPGIRTIVGHGQMDGEKLEKVMFDFINGDFDVLIATTIIESGLDIPNTNTIFINNAQNFGLSELHQLRGRVGRSNKKAFCYLLTPPLEALNPDARKRLQAIEEFSDIGSGFNLAMQDLDIRGAGNLLGGEQSGFIADIGFEAYQRILNEAMDELRHDEFQGVFDEQDIKDQQNAFLGSSFIRECTLDTDLELLLPDDYISSISERVLLYRELDDLKSEETLSLFEKNLQDRFGKLPDQARELLDVVRLRWVALSLNMEKLIIKDKKMICFLPSDQSSKYYLSADFATLMRWISQHPSGSKVKEIKGKLTLILDPVTSIRGALDKLHGIAAFIRAAREN